MKSHNFIFRSLFLVTFAIVLLSSCTSNSSEGHGSYADNDLASAIGRYVTCPTDSVEMMLNASDSIILLVDTCSLELLGLDNAADEAFEMTNKTWAAIEHPGKDAFVNYIDWLSNIDTLLRQSIASGKGDGEMDVWRYEKLREVLQAPLDKCSWKKETKALTGNFRWVKDISLTEDAVTGRNNEIAKCDEIIASIRGGLTEQQAIKDKEEEEKSQAELEMYWENHPEERQLLEDELKSLFEEKENINTEINRINDELKEFNKEDSSKYDEKKKVVTKIRDLRVQLSKYGIFAGKEKRAIEEQLEKESKTLAEIEEAINLENKEKWENADKMIPELKQQKDDLRVQLADINKRIKEVNKSLSKGK